MARIPTIWLAARDRAAAVDVTAAATQWQGDGDESASQDGQA